VDLVVITTRGELAATLIPDSGGARDVRQASSGFVSLPVAPGRYVLLAHARDADTLGRQSLSVRVRAFGFPSALSDLLVAAPWPAEAVDRSAMLQHLRRDLTFRAGESVRVYAEMYGVGQTAGRINYRATYQLLKTAEPSRDALREDWPSATKFTFDRTRLAGAGSVEVEILDLDPRHLSPGTYLLRLVIDDLTAALTTNTGSGNRLSFYASGLHEVMDAVLTAAT
jgi:hypothetical protein